MPSKGETVTVLTKEGLFSCRTIAEILPNGSLRMAPVMYEGHILQAAETFSPTAIWKCKGGCGCGDCKAKRKFTLALPAVPQEKPKARKSPVVVTTVSATPEKVEPEPEPVVVTEPITEPTQKRRGRPPGSKNKPKESNFD